jgi:hypothetical protein
MDNYSLNNKGCLRKCRRSKKPMRNIRSEWVVGKNRKWKWRRK